MSSLADILTEIRGLIAVHARPELVTPIRGLTLAKVDSAEPHHALTEPLLVVLAQGGKRILLGSNVFEYRAGQCLVVTASLPVTGHFIGASRQAPAMGLGLALRPAAIAPLLLEIPVERWSCRSADQPAIATSDACPQLLDALARLLRLLDRPADAPVLGPLIEREILWRLLTGPHGQRVRQVGLADSSLSQVNRVIQWIRENYTEPVRIPALARLAGVSESTLHRHFRTITTLSPLQYQKHIRLQEARTLLVADADDIVGVAHLVGYESPSQFNREYRRMFGVAPSQDVTRLRSES